MSDLLAKMQARRAEVTGTEPAASKPSGSMLDRMKALKASTDSPADRIQELTAKRRAKRQELREAARKERDWVSEYRNGEILLVVPAAPEQRVKIRGSEAVSYNESAPALRTRSTRVTHTPAPAPTKTEDRSVEELYALLQERWRRAESYEDPKDKRAALENAQRIVELLSARGQSDEAIMAAIGLEASDG